MVFVDRFSWVLPLALVALLRPVSPAHAEFGVEQLTDNASASCGSFLPAESANGQVVAFESDCDFEANNPDGSFEIFLVEEGQAPRQLTEGSACSSGAVTMNTDGSRIAFESDCDLTGGNPDRNVEIFLWKDGLLGQLTTSFACDNFAPSMDAAGNTIAFDSDCAYGETNLDGSSEIFQVTAAGVITPLTSDDSGTCDSINASTNADGTVVAFDSDCDPAGTNPDSAVEIFTVTNEGVVAQATIAADDSCASVLPSIDSAGSHVAFQSDCDFTGANADRSQEIFVVGPGGEVLQLTDDPGPSPCSSSRPRISGNAVLVAFSSYCDFAGANADGSLEVFQVTVGQTPVQLTTGTSCESLIGDTNTNGRDIVFDSDCDPLGTNADAGTEIFQLNACVCGAPMSRRLPPKASDALFTLRAAVGLVSCLPCECDTDSSGKILTSDALRILQAAVGLSVPLSCPAS